tara:strand:- start:15450 stop:16385 length:936 start_codon:yes stop_codon:yes gene_type:complete
MKIEEIKSILKLNGPRLAYQSLDGMNWKQITFNDIKTNIDYINSYLIKKDLVNKNVLSLSSNCIESYILESLLMDLGSKLSFASQNILLDVQFNMEFDIVIVDSLEEILDNHILKNVVKDKIVISIANFKKSKEISDLCISLQNIYKIGLLSRKDSKEREKELSINFIDEFSIIESNKLKFYSLNDMKNFMKRNEFHFNSINENEFSTSLYLKKDLFSKSLNLFFLKNKNKFTNNKSVKSLLININEIMPINLIIDSDSLREIIKLCYVNKVKFSELTGSKIKKIITYNMAAGENLEMLKNDKIDLVNLNN